MPIVIYLLLLYLLPQVLKEQFGIESNIVYASILVLMASVSTCKAYQIRGIAHAKWYQNIKLHYGLLFVSLGLLFFHIIAPSEMIGVFIGIVSAVMVVVFAALTFLIW
jgi:hypothetical protein